MNFSNLFKHTKKTRPAANKGKTKNEAEIGRFIPGVVSPGGLGGMGAGSQLAAG